ncbi:G1/S-specific cyclin-D3 [Sorochytrium milnesiophthora]
MLASPLSKRPCKRPDALPIFPVAPPDAFSARDSSATQPTYSLALRFDEAAAAPSLALAVSTHCTAPNAWPPTPTSPNSFASVNLMLSRRLQDLLRDQDKFAPAHDFLTLQRGDKRLLRENVISWLIKINKSHKVFRYHSDTLYLTVNYMDRYLSAAKVSRSGQYHLIGMTCYSLAAKMAEEFIDPFMEDMVLLLKPWGFTSKDIRKMEKKILATLNFDLCTPAPHDFLGELFSFPDVRACLTPGYCAIPSFVPPSHCAQQPHDKVQPPQFASQMASPPASPLMADDLPALRAPSPRTSWQDERWLNTQMMTSADRDVYLTTMRTLDSWLLALLPKYDIACMAPSVLAITLLNLYMTRRAEEARQHAPLAAACDPRIVHHYHHQQHPRVYAQPQQTYFSQHAHAPPLVKPVDTAPVVQHDLLSPQMTPYSIAAAASAVPSADRLCAGHAV